MVVLKDLKKRRLEIGLSQKNCAEKLDIPLRTYQRYESGESIGNPEYLCRIVRLFSINIDEINQSEDDIYTIYEMK